MNLPLTKSELIEWFQGLTDVYLASYGEEYQLDTVIKSPTVIPNRNFKEGIPATQVIETRTLSDNLISINYSTIYDYDTFEKLFKENFPNQEYHESKMNSSSNYIYNSKTGWIEKIEISSETETEFEKTGFNMNYEIK